MPDNPTIAPYGAWRSPITASMLVSDAVRLSLVQVDGDDVYWIERRPSEGGRQALVRWRDGEVSDVLGSSSNARTLVHEYGGRSYAVRDGVVVWSEFADQRLYRLDGGEPEPVALTAEPSSPRPVRYADHELTPDGRWVLCVRERHLPAPEGVVNDLVAVPVDGSGDGAGNVVVLASGHDFFAAPRVSPDGRRLAWLAWDHPNMPWDGTELFVAPFDGESGAVVGDALMVAGGRDESVTEPRWSPDGVLHWVSDRTGWWNLYSERRGLLARVEAEFAPPHWVFGTSSYAFLGDGTLVASWTASGLHRIGIVDDGEARAFDDVPYTVIAQVHALGGDGVVALMGSAADPITVARFDVAKPGGVEVLRAETVLNVDPAFVSEPVPITYSTVGDREAHALFYAPANPSFAAPDGELPPLVVLSHGGPTSRATPAFDLEVQFFTSRGIAVVDVNYGGSTGYGRSYRSRLDGAWGIVDVDDCIAAAQWLASSRRVDPRRLVIRGGSAGGFTTLAALTFHPDVFACGSSHYGVADLEALARDTHKFESRYLDRLVGPYPDDVDTYRARSPIHHTDRLSCPLILFQGLEDMVVPPEQSQMMAEALDVKGIPHAYLAFEGEQHGFRRSETIVRVAEAELYFFGRVLGFTPADEVAPVRIEHEEALS